MDDGFDPYVVVRPLQQQEGALQSRIHLCTWKDEALSRYQMTVAHFIQNTVCLTLLKSQHVGSCVTDRQLWSRSRPNTLTHLNTEANLTPSSPEVCSDVSSTNGHRLITQLLLTPTHATSGFRGGRQRSL